MPIYEYLCTSCDTRFEEFVRGAETPACTNCGSHAVTRKLSTFKAHGARVTEYYSESDSGSSYDVDSD